MRESATKKLLFKVKSHGAGFLAHLLARIREMTWYIHAIIFNIFFLCTHPASANPGAWPQAKGRGQIILNTSTYQSDSFFDFSGEEQPQPRYQKYELNPYMEYGLTQSQTIGANLFLQRLAQENDRSFGLGDSEFFFRQRLWQNKNFVFSLQPLVKLPSPSPDEARPVLGSDTPDLALALNAGYSFALFGQQHFAETSIEYRHRLGMPGDQLRTSATLGLRPFNRLLLLNQLFLTNRVSEPTLSPFTESPQDDYQLVKLQISAVYALNSRQNIQLGGFSHLSGSNAGAGGGVLLSFWQGF